MKSTFTVSAIITLLILSILPATKASEIHLEAISPVSYEGYFNLRWNNMTSNKYKRLQMGMATEFSEVIKSYPLGTANQIALSGFEDGQYYFRVVDDTGQPASNTVSVEVKHRNVSDALQLFISGATIFVLLLLSLFFAPRYAHQSKQR